MLTGVLAESGIAVHAMAEAQPTPLSPGAPSPGASLSPKSPSPKSPAPMPAIPSGSESDLSPVNDVPNFQLDGAISDEDEYQDDHESALSEADDGADMMSDDGDYKAKSPAKPVVQPSRQSRSSSESLRPNKRKLALEDADIEANPELYGIRRSHRARKLRRYTESASNGESDSDVAVHPRKRRRPASNRGKLPMSTLR